MLFLVGYSCFTSIYYVAFSPPSEIAQKIVDWIVEVFFYLDIIFYFFQEYKDPETFENVSSYKRIAAKYVFRGWFIIDFISVFPFMIFLQSNALLTKMFRLFRLPRLVKLMDSSRFN